MLSLSSILAEPILLSSSIQSNMIHDMMVGQMNLHPLCQLERVSCCNLLDIVLHLFFPNDFQNLRRVDLVTYLPLQYEASIQGISHYLQHIQLMVVMRIYIIP